MPTRVIVSGDRHWRCDALAARIVERLRARYGSDLVIVHAAAPGVDSAFDLAAIKANVGRESACENRQPARDVRIPGTSSPRMKEP